MNYFKQTLIIVLALGLGSLSQAAVIKFATLAPDGSTWMNVMREWDKELQSLSEGKLKFRFYPGGISGDEKDVVKKIRFGQLQSAGFTGVGLGEIAPEVRILDTPFLFNNNEEVDYIYKTFDAEWKEMFQKKGYILLGWSDVGFVYFFTNDPLNNLKDLKGIKMWMWEGDPIAEASFKVIGVNPVPLSITDVMTSLQTGLIDGVYSSPLAILALQWFTKTKYRSDFPLTHASGAVLLSRKLFDKLPKDQQDLLLTTGKKYLSKLNKLSREENGVALQSLKKNGIEAIPIKSSEDIKQFHSFGSKARKDLVGRLYSQELLDKVEKALVDYRSTSKKKK